MQLGLPRFQPAVGKEFVNLRSFRGREASKNILQVLEGINLEALACFDQAHDCRSCFSTFLGAGEEPISAAEHHRLHAAFAAVVTDFDKVVIEVYEKRGPTVERICDGLAEFCLWKHRVFCFIQPGFEKFNFRFCEALANIDALFWSQSCSDALNVEEAFDDAHRECGSCRLVLPSVLEVAVYVRPAICRGRTFLDDAVELVGAICLQNSFVSFENSLWVKRVLCVGIVVANVWLAGIAAVYPNVCSVRLSQSLFDHRHRCGIGLNDAAVQYPRFHSLHNLVERLSDALQPARHGRAVDWNFELFENLLLPVEREMEPEFVGGYLCQKSRTGLSFVDWLVGLMCGDHLSAALLACILKHDVLDVLEKRAHEFNLVRNFKTDNLPGFATAWTEQFIACETVLFFSGFNGSGGGFATATVLGFFNNIQTLLFGFQLAGGLQMNCFSCTSEKRCIDLGRLLPEHDPVAATELFFQLGDSGEKFFDQGMAVCDVVGEIFGRGSIGFRRLSRHDFSTCRPYNYTIQ